MSEMIERVAKAIFKADNTTGVTWEDDTLYWERDDYRKLARAAIGAMREPTMDMEAAAANWQGAQMTYSDVWRTMIDEALK